MEGVAEGNVNKTKDKKSFKYVPPDVSKPARPKQCSFNKKADKVWQ